jgi:hypothetical protein
MKTQRFEVVVKGHLSDRHRSALEEVSLQPRDGTTVLRAPFVDQAQLFGVLERLRNLGLDLVSVRVGDGS